MAVYLSLLKLAINKTRYHGMKQISDQFVGVNFFYSLLLRQRVVKKLSRLKYINAI